MWVSTRIEIILYGLVLNLEKRRETIGSQTESAPRFVVTVRLSIHVYLPAKMSIKCILIPIKHLWGDYISKEDSTIKQISR